PFVVTVRDAGGNPVSGFQVTFAVTAGGGTLSAATPLTDASGQAQTVLTLGKAAGANAVTATAPGLGGSPLTFTAGGTARPAAQLTILSGNNQSGAVGTALPAPLRVVVRDANGNGVMGISVSFAVASGGGTLSSAATLSDASGIAQTVLTLGTTPGANTATA